METIKVLNEATLNKADYVASYASAIVVNNENKLVLQQRGETWPTFPGVISTFGGKLEPKETPENALIRELKEELGATVEAIDVIYLGVITESVTNYTELVYTYFWRDLHNTITGCYEGEIRTFTMQEVYNAPKLMDYVSWMLQECKIRNLL